MDNLSFFKLLWKIIRNTLSLLKITKQIGLRKCYTIFRKLRFWNELLPSFLKINDEIVSKLFMELLKRAIESPESASRDILDIFSKITGEDVKLIQKASQFEINGIISGAGIGERGSTNHVMSGNSDLLSREDIRNLYDKGLTRNDPACHHPVYVKTKITADSNVNLPPGEYEFNYGYLTLSKEASSIFITP